MLRSTFSFSAGISESSLLPVITGHNEDQTLRQGDSVSLLCKVANSCLPSPEMLFACGGRRSHKMNRRENETSLEIQIRGLKASDHGLKCVCEATWQFSETAYKARFSLETSFILLVEGNLIFFKFNFSFVCVCV